MPGRGAQRRERGDVDDVAAAALDHSGSGELGAQDDAEQVDGDRALGDVVGLVDELSRRGDCSVVDQDVDGARLAFDVVKERRERLGDR